MQYVREFQLVASPWTICPCLLLTIILIVGQNFSRQVLMSLLTRGVADPEPGVLVGSGLGNFVKLGSGIGSYYTDPKFFFNQFQCIFGPNMK